MFGPNAKETEDRFLSLQERQELRRTRRPCGTWTWPPLRRRTCRQAARSRRLLWEPAGSNLASCRGCLWRRQCARGLLRKSECDGVRRSESASFVTHKCDEQSQRSGGVGVFLELRHDCLSRASGWDLLPGLSRRRATSHKPGNARMQL